MPGIRHRALEVYYYYYHYHHYYCAVMHCIVGIPLVISECDSYPTFKKFAE